MAISYEFMGMDKVRDLVADMSAIDVRVARHIPPVVRKGAVNIKDGMRRDLRGSSNRGFQAIAGTVSFDFRENFAFGGGEISAEVGPVTPDGALENIAYFGSWKGGGTVADPATVLEDELPRFVRELEALAEELTLGD